MLPRYSIFQQAHLVNDLETACHQWNRLLGAGPFFLTWHHRTDWFTYRDTDVEADVSYAFGYLGDLMIQFIQQHDDQPSIYREMYAEGQEGFHHVAVLVNDYAGERQRIADLGFDIACELRANDAEAAYVDTRAVNGGFTELHSDPPRIVAMFAQWRRAHELWRAGDPVIVERPARPPA